MKSIQVIAEELETLLQQRNVQVSQHYDSKSRIYYFSLNKGKNGTIRLTDEAIRKKWQKYRFEISTCFPKFELKIDNGTIYYQIPLAEYKRVIDIVSSEQIVHDASILDMAKFLKQELKRNGFSVHYRNKKDGIYLNNRYETIRIGNSTSFYNKSYRYDLRKDAQKSIQRKKVNGKRKNHFTVSFQHYNWIIQEMNRRYYERPPIPYVATKLKAAFWEKGIKVKEHKSNTTNSTYLHLDFGLLGTIRISDHKSEHKNNKYEICPFFNCFQKGIREDKNWTCYEIPIRDWEKAISMVMQDREYKIQYFGRIAYQFKMDKMLFS